LSSTRSTKITSSVRAAMRFITSSVGRESSWILQHAAAAPSKMVPTLSPRPRQ
jgi:hypothetical protein